MDPKTVIGGDVSLVALRAASEQVRADNATRDLTMMQRRIRTFYDAISEVRFPEDPPSWAPQWLDWLLTGERPIAYIENTAAAAEAAVTVDAEIALVTEEVIVEEEPPVL